MFKDRKDAALQLAKALEDYKDKKVVVLGIPRGGVETAYYVARHLHAEFSLLVSRKLGHPDNPEYAFGALAEDGSIYINPYAREGISEETINRTVGEQKKEIERRINILRKGKSFPVIHGKTVILVDDGIATGATIFAAIEMCKKRGAARIVVAAPVSSHSMDEKLINKADEVIILHKPYNFFAVSQVYETFNNLTDQAALEFMDRWEMEKGVLKED